MINGTRSVAIIAGLFALGGSTAVMAQPSRSMEGLVSKADGTPLPNATVKVAGTELSALTGETGSFQIAKAPRTQVTLEISAAGFVARELIIAAGRGKVTALAVSLTAAVPPPPKVRVVSGLVRDTDGAPVVGAAITVQGMPGSVVTDEDGFFVLGNVPATNLVIEVSAANYAPTTAEILANQDATKVQLTSTSTTTPIEPPPATGGRQVSGTLSDTAGDPVIGAIVKVKGTELLAISDETGAFVIQGASTDAVEIEIDATGYNVQTLPVPANSGPVLGIMSFAASSEVIIVQGRQPVIIKQNLANGASVVSADDLNRVSAQTLEGGLVGKVSGANLQSNSGAPGGGAQIRLRGISTINGQSSPLIVVDGVVISNSATASGANAITNAAGGGSASPQDNPVNRLADLNPNDIATVEVLKGAAAGALYGSKAANGVVIITTKGGASGKTKVTVTQRLGFAQVSNTLGSRKFTSAAEVMETYGSQDIVDLFNQAGGQTFDHEAAFSRTPLLRETIASASGGTNNGRYYGSVLIKDEPGVVVGSFYEKQAGKLNLSYDFGDRVTLGLAGNFVHSLSDRGLTNNDNSGTSYYLALSGTPSFVNLEQMDNGLYPNNPFSSSNPVQTANLLTNREDVWRFIGSTNLGIKVWEDEEHAVSLRGTYGVDRFQQKNNIVSPPELQFEGDDGLLGTVIDGDTGNLNWNVGVTGIWEFTPNSQKFRSALSVGFAHDVVDRSSVYVVGQNLVAGQPNVDSATAVATNEQRFRTEDQGLYLQEEVALLDERLSLLGGLLAERSSLNGDTDKFFLFPKIAATYSIPGLDSTFDLLKARAAYGEAGNRPNFGQKFTALNAGSAIDGNPALTLGGNAGDPNIEPERQREIELGVDAVTKDEFVTAELTGYWRGISNLLLQRALPTSTGFTTEFFNGGSMRNLGLEAAVAVRPVREVVDWTTRVILTMNRSKITDLPDGIDFFDVTNVGFGAGLGAYRIEKGKSATQLVGSAGEAGVIAIGNGEPDFRIGWSNKVQYKSLTLTTLVDWQQGSDVVNLTRLLYDFGSNSEDFTTAGTARLDAFGNGDVRPYIESATFVKLREVSVNYDFPKHIVEQMGPFTQFATSVSGRNLLTLTNYSGLDPEVSNFGNQPVGRNYDVGPYPPSRSFWFSVSAGF